MTALLAPLTWWPFTPPSPIHDVEPDAKRPGLVTLTWTTLEPCPTELRSDDGRVLFRDPRARTDHHVTLTGQAGHCQAIDIHALDACETVEIRF